MNTTPCTEMNTIKRTDMNTTAADANVTTNSDTNTHPSSEQARRIRLGTAWQPKPPGTIKIPDLSKAFQFEAGAGKNTSKEIANSTRAGVCVRV